MDDTTEMGAISSRRDLLIVDHYHRVNFGKGSAKDKRAAMEDAVRDLAGYAKEANCACLLLCQLNRGIERREGWDKRPKMSDLREIGALEEEAESIAFMFRPKQYGLEPSHEMLEGMDPDEYTEAVFAKNRHGETGSVKLRFVGSRVTFRGREAA